MSRKIIAGVFLGILLVLAILLRWPQNPEKFAASLISTNDDTRNLALQKISTMSDAKKNALVAPLIAALGNSDWHARRFSLYALRRLGTHDDRVAPALLTSLRDSEPDVRREAAIGLSENGIKSIPVLVNALEKTDPLVTPNVRGILIGMGPAAVPSIIEGLRNPNPVVRRELASALGRIKPAPTEAAAALRAAMKDTDLGVRMGAATSLNAIDPKDKQTLPIYIEALKQKKQEFPIADSVMALEALGPDAKSALPALKEALPFSTDSLKNPQAPRPLIARALNKIDPRRSEPVDLLWDLKQNDSTLRYRAAFALSEMSPPDVGTQSGLVAALDDTDPFVSARALAALAKIGFNQSERFQKPLIAKSVRVITATGETRMEGLTDAVAGALKKMDAGLVTSNLMPFIKGSSEPAKTTAAHLLEKFQKQDLQKSAGPDEDAAALKDVQEPRAP